MFCDLIIRGYIFRLLISMVCDTCGFLPAENHECEICSKIMSIVVLGNLKY